MQRNIDPNPENHRRDEDWEGNNIAVTCPICVKVYIVSEQLHHNGRRTCPSCGKSEGAVRGGRKSGGTASVSWSE